jgi:hypothetical protein
MSFLQVIFKFVSRHEGFGFAGRTVVGSGGLVSSQVSFQIGSLAESVIAYGTGMGEYFWMFGSFMLTEVKYCQEFLLLAMRTV